MSNGNICFPNPVVYLTSSRGPRDVWLKHRREGLGGSDIAAVIGESPWRTPLAVWAEKTGRDPGQSENEAMRWGQLLEDVVAREWANRCRGIALRRCGLIADQLHPHRLASVDRVILKPGTLRATELVEIKTTGPSARNLTNDELLRRYVLQVQWYLGITGLEVAHVVVLVGGQELRELEYEHNPAIFAELAERADEFWQLHVLQDMPPPATAPDNPRMAQWFPADPELADPADLTPWFGLIDQLRSLHAQLTDLTHRRDELEAVIKEQLGPHTAGAVNGDLAVTWRESTSHRVDIAGLRRERPDLVDEFTLPTTCRRFLLKGSSA